MSTKKVENAAKRLGIMITFVLVALVISLGGTDFASRWVPVLANPIINFLVAVLVIAALLLLLLRKTKMGKRVVANFVVVICPQSV